MSAAACGSGGTSVGNAAVVSASEYKFTIDQPMKPGLNTITLKNSGKEEHQITIVQLTDGKTMADVGKALAAQPLVVPPWMRFSGGVAGANPNAQASVETEMPAGKYILLCFTSGADGVPHAAKGMITELDLAGEAVKGKVSAGTAKVIAKDYAFELPKSVKAGDVALRLENNGKETHEVGLIQLAPGMKLDDIKKLLSAPPSPSAPPPPPITGAGAIAAGSAEVVHLKLAKGSYVAICFVPDPKGAPHFSLGMVGELQVE